MKTSIGLAVVTLSVTTFAQSQSGSTAISAPPDPGSPSPQTSSVSDVDSAKAREGIIMFVRDYQLGDLPQAVQNTMQLRFAGRKIADIDHEIHDGHTIWEIELEQEQSTSEIFIDQNGILVPEPGLIDFTVTRPVPVPGKTTVSQDSSSLRGQRWEDLPPLIQQKAALFGNKDQVADIDREKGGDGRMEYEIEFRADGGIFEVQIADDGTIKPNNDPHVATVGSAPGVEIGSSSGPVPAARPRKAANLPGQSRR